MNAHTLDLTRDGLVSALSASERSPAEAVRRVDRAIARYGNPDDFARPLAIAAFTAGKPSWWTTQTYHNQRAKRLLTAILCRGVAIEDVFAEAYPTWLETKVRIGGLDDLVPLNILAANELSETYEMFGLWRDAGELEARRLVKRARK